MFSLARALLSPDSAENRSSSLLCLYFEESADIIAADAKMHWVDKWPFENLP